MSAEPERLIVGRVSGVYGVKGFVRIFSETEPRAAIAGFSQLWLQRGDDWELLEVESGRAHGRGVVLKFRETVDRDAACALVGSTLAVEREWLPPLEEGAYYWADLQGLRVETKDGVDLGRITGFIETGANDVMVVRNDRERLVPWVRGRYVLDVDLAAGLVRVDWDPEF
ncbi:ribosome maturation factor RimM [Thioalkalivibrio paradoxus]|uniref:Ribosome maturation factor RimM n=1 Tax=Thioalkalivibrio paradoxus ARh 1 TaxID=713585 RepID=W0DG78_9GAMM|nr:ribosome maturation factor RimM [Thioalkalivibrio paradoxus]AHE97361.1 16S rRNA-processing protein RimM [Thioalkalivibrio paradoxus ARh 1]